MYMLIHNKIKPYKINKDIKINLLKANKVF